MSAEKEFKLTWIEPQKRWSKRYRGKLYQISCYQLRCGKTREESQALAELWWVGKRKELDDAYDIEHGRKEAVVEIDPASNLLSQLAAMGVTELVPELDAMIQRDIGAGI